MSWKILFMKYWKVAVKALVVDAKLQQTILLFDEEDGHAGRGGGGSYEVFSKHIVKVILEHA
ncbi:hypothetical protein C0995_015319 [Termitomyces sp. Mi166|nr:hypothetical protein C0995_015319 [Termitomyces sp. Mi166\